MQEDTLPATKIFKLKSVPTSKTFTEEPFAEFIAPRIAYWAIFSILVTLWFACIVSCSKMSQYDIVKVTGGNKRTNLGGVLFVLYCVLLPGVVYIILKYAIDKKTFSKIAAEVDKIDVPRHFPLNFEAEVLMNVSMPLGSQQVSNFWYFDFVIIVNLLVFRIHKKCLPSVTN